MPVSYYSPSRSPFHIILEFMGYIEIDRDDLINVLISVFSEEFGTFERKSSAI